MAFVSPLCRLNPDLDSNNNHVRNQGNLLYLALITDRIPVIPKFTPSHVLADGHVDDLPFGDVFDVPRLASLIRSPVLEWRDVKMDESPVVESMGCWAVWPEQQYYESTPREGWFPRNSGLGAFFLLVFSQPLLIQVPRVMQMFRSPRLPVGSRPLLVMNMTRLPVSGSLPDSASPMPAESG